MRLIFIYRWLGIESHDSSACTTRKRREGEGGLSLLSPLLLLPFHSVSSRESGAERGSRNGEGGSDAGASTEPRQGAAGALRCLPIAPPSSLLFLCLSVGSASSLCHLPQSFNAVLTYGWICFARVNGLRGSCPWFCRLRRRELFFLFDRINSRLCIIGLIFFFFSVHVKLKIIAGILTNFEFVLKIISSIKFW